MMPPPSGHRWSFSLRTLLWVVTVCCVMAATIHANPPLGLALLSVVLIYVFAPLLRLARSWTLLLAVRVMAALDRLAKWRRPKG